MIKGCERRRKQKNKLLGQTLQGWCISFQLAILSIDSVTLLHYVWLELGTHKLGHLHGKLWEGVVLVQSKFIVQAVK